MKVGDLVRDFISPHETGIIIELLYAHNPLLENAGIVALRILYSTGIYDVFEDEVALINENKRKNRG